MSSFLNPTFIIAILVALSVHEAAHAFIAYKLGDHTAKLAGRMTLNPIAHLDPLGTILFILVGFGWGKPVPVNPYYFKHPDRDSALTALAGPVSNLILAILAFIGLKLMTGFVPSSSIWSLIDGAQNDPNVFFAFCRSLLSALLFINLGLMAFNLLPIAPLDGSKIVLLVMPRHFRDDYEEFMQWGPYALLVLLIAGNFLNFDLLGIWVHTIMGYVLMAFSMAFGG